MKNYLKKTLNYKLVLIILLITLASGCSFSELFDKLNLPFQGVSSEDDVKMFYGGDDGVEFEIVSPFDEYYKNIPLSVGVDMKNKGESETNGQICLFGLNKEVFEGFAGECKCESFYLTTLMYERSERLDSSKSLSFGPYSFSPDQSFTKSQTLSVSVTYSYASYAIFEACIRENILGEKGCEYKDKELLKSTSGAPIKVVSVKEKIIPTDDEILTLLFDIEIKNKGDGFIVNEVDGCEYEIAEEINVELINAPGSIECSKAVFNKKEDKYIAKCTVEQVKNKDYKTDVTIKLDYIYKDIKSKIFDIV